MAEPGERFRDDGTWLGDFADRILVECPKCQGCAVMQPMEHDAAGWERMRGARRVTCAGCGYVALADRTKPRVGERSTNKLTLWLQARCLGEVLWAYNEAHLAWLEQFVAARHRERQEPYSGNKTMASRLPRWMKSRENRSAVLSKLSELRARLPG